MRSSGTPSWAARARRHLDEDRLLALAEQRHPRHARHQHQLAAQEVDVVVQLARAVALAGDGIEEREDVAEVALHHRLGRARRQRARGLGDLAAQLVPHLVELGLGARERQLRLDLHQRLAGARHRDDLLHLLHLLHRAFDAGR
jgi:hypothetical protein